MQHESEQANLSDGLAHAVPDATTHTFREHTTEGINQ